MTSLPPEPPAPPPPGDPPQAATTPPPGTIDAESKQMAMLAHLLGALVGFIGPLIIWLIKKDKSPFVDYHGKEALNFSLTLLIGYLITSVAYVGISMVTCGFGAFLPLPLVVWIFQIVFGIIACLKANNGEYYRYPICIRMIP
ncbi:MAG: DUF4870 domain-containing protein [Planctomycetia bacterium]|nr:DUF4870 domain-containing protein [Planctomycetia bacterium]